MRYIFLIVCFLIGVNGFSQSTYNCIYDDLNRLTEVQYGNGTTIQYQYDKVGNRISKIINGVTNNQPDIIPTNGNLSLSSVGIGSDVTLTFLNENIGTASTGSFNTLIVLSDNATYEAGVDEVLATLYTSNLVAGAMPSVSQVLTIPNNVSTGSKNIIIISDVDDDVSNELAETNNELVLNITLVDCNGLTATVTPTDETCDDDNGAASVSANNGAAPYSYTWNSSPPQTGTSASNLSSGNYEVSVLDQNGCEVISAFTINNVGDDPIANFNFSPFNLNVNFTSTSLYGTSYVWDFGDGNSSTLTNPNHTYSSNGTYSVCLDVTNSCGTDQYCTNVLISGNSCDIPIGLSSSNNTPTSVTLSWNNVSGANSYNLRYKETGATTWNNSTIAPPLVTLNGLQAGTAYEFQVEAVCSSGGSTYSSSSYFNTNAGGGSTSADEFFLVYEHPSQSLLGRDLFKTSTGHYITSELNHIVKHDSLGEIEWVKKYEIGSTTFYIESTIETADGGYVAVGDYTVSGNTDMFVLKLDINGAVQWAKTYGDADDDYGRSIIQDASGNYVCIGYTRGYGAGSADAMVIKLDSTGDIIWSKRYGNSMFGVGLHVIEASGGGYIMLGRHTEIIPLNPGSAVANTMDIWKLSTSGALVWKKTYHPLDHTHDYDVSRIFQNSDGNIYMCGNFNNGERRGLVVKFNSAGDIQWGKYMSSPFEDDRLFSIGIDSNGDVLAMGETNVSSSSQEDVSVYKLSANNGNLLGAYYIFANDDQFSFGGLIDGDYLVATGQTEDFGTDNNDDAFLIRRKTDFSNTCQGNSFTPTTGSISTGIATFNFTGDITMTTVTQSITVSIPTISTIYPCGGGCQTIASITTSSSTICQDETISFYSTSTNAIDYKWEIDGVQFSTIANPTYTFNTAGTFNISLTVTDGASCSDQTSIQVISHPLPSISINTTNEQCSGADGTATVDVSAVTSPQILWSNGSTSSTISNLSAGNYGVLVTDINGCTTNQNFSINNSSNGFTISSIVEDVTCSGASDGRIIITPSGTVGNITYTWTGGTLTNYSAIKMDFDSNLTTDFIQLYGDFDQADQYLVGDWNGDGKDNIAYRIGQNIYMDFDYDHIPDFTQNYGTGNTEDDYIVGDWDGDGSDNIAVVRGFEVWMDYDFDNNHDYIQTYGTGNTFDKFLVGDWDGNGTDNLAYRVGNTIYMDFDFNSIPDLTQNFGNGNSEDDYLSGDWNGDGTDNLALVRGDEVWMNYNFDSNHDYIQTYGTGFSFDQYYVGDWDGNGTSNLAYIYGKGVTSLSSGNYDLTISDAAGCSNTENFTIDEPNPITVVPSANPETTCNASNGTITLSTTGGTLPYSYSWSSGQTTSSIIGLSPGTYTVTVTDANNCSETTFANINSSSCGIVLSSVSKDSIEFNFPNGFVGSSSNFYIWSRENGKVDGTIQISNNQVVFLPNTPHQAGDQLMITLRGIQDSQNNSYDDQSWIEYAPVTNTTSAKFGSVFTGITLPTEAMNYSYHLSNADLNQDGLNDIIFRYHSAYGQPTKVLTYLQNTNQTFAAPTTYQNSYSHSNLGGTPDLNNDGFPDLVLTHNVPSRLHIRLNNGDGTFSNPTYYTTTNYVNQVDFGDIDQDGDIDVVTHSGNASLSANTFSVFKNNGDGTFQSQQTTSTGIFGGGLELGDLDNDGDLDIVYTSSTSFNSGKFFRVYENNGSGGFSLFSSEANPSDLRINNLIDLNDDGNLDVILRR
ncbi:MAG: PKD domain-containing protein, partial [Bacteroidota bacterium]